MGQEKNRGAVKRHRLLVYQRISERMRTIPFLLAGLSLILLGLGWLSTQDFMQQADTGLLSLLWTNKLYLMVILFVSGMVYIYGMLIGRVSHVQAGKATLQIQAGLLAINISYRRINQVRLSQVGVQYPADMLRGADADLLDPLLSTNCTLVDMRSWPTPGRGWLRRLWSKYMFGREGDSLMLIVPDAMILNQQIDSQVALLQARSKQSQYLDPLERAVQQQKKANRR